MSNLKTLLSAAAVTGVLAGTAAANETEILKERSKNLIGGTYNIDNLSILGHEFSILSEKAQRRAKFLEIQNLLPAIEEDIKAWSRRYDDGKPKRPESENIRKLQPLIGVNKPDGIFGKGTAKEFVRTLNKSLRLANTFQERIPALSIADNSSTESLLKTLEPKRYAGYVENLHDNAARGEKTWTDIAINSSRSHSETKVKLAKIVKLGFEQCTGRQIEVNADEFLRDIITALDTEEGKIDAVVEKACKPFLDEATKEQREELLSSLKENLSEDINKVRVKIEAEEVIAQMRRNIAADPALAEKILNQVNAAKAADIKEPTP